MMYFLPVIAAVNVSAPTGQCPRRPQRGRPPLPQVIYGYGVYTQLSSMTWIGWLLAILSLGGHYWAYESILDKWAEPAVAASKMSSE